MRIGFNVAFKGAQMSNQKNKQANSLKLNSLQHGTVTFGLYDAKDFEKDVLKKTIKGSRKDSDIVSNIMWESDDPSVEKKKLLEEYIKIADPWYKPVLENLYEQPEWKNTK